MNWIARVFQDSRGDPSSKRVFGALLIVAGVVSNFVNAGDPETNIVMIWAGIASLGVGVLETKVSN